MDEVDKILRATFGAAHALQTERDAEAFFALVAADNPEGLPQNCSHYIKRFVRFVRTGEHRRNQ